MSAFGSVFGSRFGSRFGSVFGKRLSAFGSRFGRRLSAFGSRFRSRFGSRLSASGSVFGSVFGSRFGRRLNTFESVSGSVFGRRIYHGSKDHPEERGVLGGLPLRLKELPCRRGYQGKLELVPEDLQAFHYWEVPRPSTYYENGMGEPIKIAIRNSGGCCDGGGCASWWWRIIDAATAPPFGFGLMRQQGKCRLLSRFARTI